MSTADLPSDFKAKNERRLDLLDKMFSGFTDEEKNRRFDQHPGWEAECERRHRQNLTDAEHAELKKLEEYTDRAVNAAFPLPFDKLEELERLVEEHKKRKEQP